MHTEALSNQAITERALGQLVEDEGFGDAHQTEAGSATPVWRDA